MQKTPFTMKKYISSLEESKAYYLNLFIECKDVFYTSPDYFVFLSTVINRAMNINRGYITLTNDNNYSCAIPIMRMMIDTCLRFWGITLVDDKHKYIMVWGSGNKIRSIKDRCGNKLTDKYLSEQFSLLYRGIDKTYNDACAFVHLSEQNLFNTAKPGDGERMINISIDGYDKMSDDVKHNIDKWMLFFNNILIDNVKSITQQF